MVAFVSENTYASVVFYDGRTNSVCNWPISAPETALASIKQCCQGGITILSSRVGLKACFVLLAVLLAGLPGSSVLRTDLLGSEKHNCCIHNLRLRTP